MKARRGSPYIDITAMVVQALSFYTDSEEVKEAVGRAVDVMADMCQKSDGYDSSESISQTIIALTAVGIDPVADDRFATDGKNLVDVLCDTRRRIICSSMKRAEAVILWLRSKRLRPRCSDFVQRREDII